MIKVSRVYKDYRVAVPKATIRDYLRAIARPNHKIGGDEGACRSPLVCLQPLMETRVTEAPQGSKACAGVVKSNYREADLGGTKLGPRMGVGILGLLRIPLLLGSAFLPSSGLSSTSSSIGLHACCR